MIQVENGEMENGLLKIFPARTAISPQITHWSVVNSNYKAYPPIEEKPVTEHSSDNVSQVTIKGSGTGFNNVGQDI